MARRAAPVKPRDIVEVTIDRLADGGRGVARHDGFVLFVQRALPGDTVRARVTRVRRSYAEAVAKEVVARGPATIEAPCPFHGHCGGCAWQALDYPAQLEAKQQQVIEAITRLGGVEDPPVRPIIGATETLGYRNKMEYSFTSLWEDDGDGVPGDDADDDAPAAGDGPEGGDGATGGDGDDTPGPETFTVNLRPPKPIGVGLGFHAAGRWDQIVPVDPCLIADPRGVPAHRVVLAWANRYMVPVYDRDTAKGMLRNLVVRVGRNTGEVMVHLVTGPGKLPRAAELVDELEAEVPGLVSVLRSVNTGSAEVATGDGEPELLWGRDHFEEVLAGSRLRVRAGSFLQTNTAMSERMYAVIEELAELRADDVAYDLYCGIGSITLLLARQVAQVVGVEVVEEAVRCAHDNIELNGLDNVEFQTGNVRPVLKLAAGVWPDPTVVVVDPPRSGLVQKVVRRICERRPERVIYVSCNPATFAGNLPWFREHGYDLVAVQAVDQFPHTPHVELVARLEPIPGWEPPVAEAVAPVEAPAPDLPTGD